MARNKVLQVAPSVLSADFSRMRQEMEKITESQSDLVHLDIMDGSFVPEITFGSKFVSDIRGCSPLPFDTHLMVEHPERMIEGFARAGSDWISFHLEAAVHAHRIIQQIRSFGKKAGISIVPSTPVQALMPLLGELDLILIMTVNPGYGGQAMLDFCVDKVRWLDEIRREQGHRYLISVDGGMNSDTVDIVRHAGVDIAVAGSAFFQADDPQALVSRFRYGRNES